MLAKIPYSRWSVVVIAVLLGLGLGSATGLSPLLLGLLAALAGAAGGTYAGMGASTPGVDDALRTLASGGRPTRPPDLGLDDAALFDSIDQAAAELQERRLAARVLRV